MRGSAVTSVANPTSDTVHLSGSDNEIGNRDVLGPLGNDGTMWKVSDSRINQHVDGNARCGWCDGGWGIFEC